MAFLPVDLVLLEQEFDPASQTFHRVAALCVHGVEIELGRNLDAHFLHRAVTGRVEVFRGVQHGLGGNAADVEAGAAERLAAFGARRLQAELGRTNCGDIATRASTDDEDVVVVFCHDSSLLTFVASQTWTGCYTVQGVKTVRGERTQIAGADQIKRVGHGWHHGTFASL